MEKENCIFCHAEIDCGAMCDRCYEYELKMGYLEAKQNKDESIDK